MGALLCWESSPPHQPPHAAGEKPSGGLQGGIRAPCLACLPLSRQGSARRRLPLAPLRGWGGRGLVWAVLLQSQPGGHLGGWRGPPLGAPPLQLLLTLHASLWMSLARGGICKGSSAPQEARQPLSSQQQQQKGIKRLKFLCLSGKSTPSMALTLQHLVGRGNVRQRVFIGGVHACNGYLSPHPHHLANLAFLSCTLENAWFVHCILIAWQCMGREQPGDEGVNRRGRGQCHQAEGGGGRRRRMKRRRKGLGRRQCLAGETK